MEKQQLIGDKNCVSYGSDLLPPGIAQAGHSTAFEGASAPPYEILNDSPTDENKRTEDVAEEKSLSGPSDQLVHADLPPPLEDWNIIFVSEQDVREAFLQYAASNCCYRTSPAKHMKIQSLTPLNAYRYRLETFTETRETRQASELYDGGFVDSSAVASPPAPWEITVDPPPLFTDCEMHIPVPHSYSVENCPNCRGRGAIMCQSCKGSGKKRCSACGGTGTSSQEDSNICSWCSGTGDNRCFSCHSNGWFICCRCSGKGNLLYHTELTITWRNNIIEHVADKDSGLPICQLKEVTGKEILRDEHPLVFPIVDFSEPSVDEYSRVCIATHQMQFTSEGLHRILRQKQIIELLPLTKIKYEWKGRSYTFYIFGNENKIYTKDYPAKCFCSVV